MKTWNQLEGNKLFNIVFSYPVEIGEIELFSLTLENDQPKLIIQFDISSLPDTPPAKWGKFNKCRLGLYCLSISDLLVKNIPCRESLNITIENTNDAFYIRASNSTSLIEFKAGFVSLSGPSVYLCGNDI